MKLLNRESFIIIALAFYLSSIASFASAECKPLGDGFSFCEDNGWSSLIKSEYESDDFMFAVLAKQKPWESSLQASLTAPITAEYQHFRHGYINNYNNEAAISIDE